MNAITYTNIRNILGSLGEPETNTNRLKFKDFAIYGNMTIMNSFYNRKNIHTYIWSSRNFNELWTISLQTGSYQIYS